MHLLLALTLLSAGQLTLQQARRATDRAFQTELAGDHAGARRALNDLLDASVDPSETSARAHIEAFLSGLEQRAALEDEASAGARAAAMRTLRDAPQAWRALYWASLSERDPLLVDQLGRARVRLRLGRTTGVDRGALRRRVEAALAEVGARVVDDAGTHELRLDVDADERVEVRHRLRARARGSFLLREAGKDGPPRSGFEQTESERVDGAQAVRLAERRLVDQLMGRVVFELRLWALRLSPPKGEPERR